MLICTLSLIISVAPKGCIVKGKSGFEFQICGCFRPPTDWSRDTAIAQWALERDEQ